MYAIHHAIVAPGRGVIQCFSSTLRLVPDT
jgi:hypothetical protein